MSIESERTVVTASTILTTKEKNVCDKTMKSSDDEAIHAVDVQSLPSNNDKLKAFPRTADVESSVLTEKQGNEEMSTKKELLKDQEDKRFQLKINNDTSILDIEVLENEDDTEENEGKSENDEVTKTSKLFLETTSEREQIITETQQHDHVSISTMDNKVAQKRVSEPLEHDEISPKKQRIPQEVVHFDEAANATDSSDNREDQLVINETEDQPDDDDESRDLEIDLEAPAPSRKRRRKTSLDTTGTGAGRSKRGRKASTTSPDKGRPQLQDNNNGASKGP